MKTTDFIVLCVIIMCLYLANTITAPVAQFLYTFVLVGAIWFFSRIFTHVKHVRNAKH